MRQRRLGARLLLCLWLPLLLAPIAVLAGTPLGDRARPQKGATWWINLARSTPNVLGNEYSALRSYAFHDTTHFSRLVFE